MEENIAILMADLTGYSALTDAHGAFSAADLIDRYLEIVENSLVGDCHLKERTGDQVMIVSSSPDNLLATAMMISKQTCKEKNFLLVHGGLHYGPILKRNNSYFGSTINVTARITSKAKAGTFWCSEEFVKALAESHSFPMESKGKHSFKNINGEMELMELAHGFEDSFYVDPVCRMLILDKDAAIKHPGEEVYFCSGGCLETYTTEGRGITG